MKHDVTLIEKLLDNATKKYGLFAFFCYLIVIIMMYRTNTTAPLIFDESEPDGSWLISVPLITLLLISQITGKIGLLIIYLIVRSFQSIFYNDPTDKFKDYFQYDINAIQNPFFKFIIPILWVCIRPIVFVFLTVYEKAAPLCFPGLKLLERNEFSVLFSSTLTSKLYDNRKIQPYRNLPGLQFLKQNAPPVLFPLEYFGEPHFIFYTVEFFFLSIVWIMIGNRRKKEAINESGSPENVIRPYYYTSILALSFICIIPTLTAAFINVTPILSILAIVFPALLVLSFIFLHVHDNYLLEYKSRPAETTREKSLKHNFDSAVMIFTAGLFLFNFYLYGNEKNNSSVWIGMTLLAVYAATCLFFSMKIKTCIQNRVE